MQTKIPNGRVRTTIQHKIRLFKLILAQVTVKVNRWFVFFILLPLLVITFRLVWDKLRVEKQKRITSRFPFTPYLTSITNATDTSHCPSQHTTKSKMLQICVKHRFRPLEGARQRDWNEKQPRKLCIILMYYRCCVLLNRYNSETLREWMRYCIIDK